jgi:aspartate aminotransferase
MGRFLDSVPFSGIIRIRDMMFAVEDPFRLDQGDVSFDAPAAVKDAMMRAVADNRTHYVQTAGLPRLRELVAEKLRRKNRIPVAGPDEVLITNGGIHAIYIAYLALLEPGDEVIVPDPAWPPAVGTVVAARGTPVACPLHERLGWRYDLEELAAKITPRTRAIYLNSPHNPTGGVLTRQDIEAIAALARRYDLWLLSDEAYEDIVYDGAEHVSPASHADMHERTISVFTFSKSYAMTGLRLGYLVIQDPTVRERATKVLFYTTSNVSTIAQYGGIGGLEAGDGPIEQFRRELQARRDLFYAGLARLGDVLSGTPPKGAFYAFVRINPQWAEGTPLARHASLSWAMAEYLIKQARIGCVPGVDFGQAGEGYLRFCFARERQELEGALQAMQALFAAVS